MEGKGRKWAWRWLFIAGSEGLWHCLKWVGASTRREKEEGGKAWLGKARRRKRWTTAARGAIAGGKYGRVVTSCKGATMAGMAPLGKSEEKRKGGSETCGWERQSEAQRDAGVASGKGERGWAAIVVFMALLCMRKRETTGGGREGGREGRGRVRESEVGWLALMW